jgi:hypothetical protein
MKQRRPYNTSTIFQHSPAFGCIGSVGAAGVCSKTCNAYAHVYTRVCMRVYLCVSVFV